MTLKQLDNSRPIDIWIWSNKPEIRKTAEYIFTQLQQKKKLRLKSDFHLPRVKNHLKVILTDLLVVHKEDPQKYLSFSRQNADYVPAGRYHKIFLHPKYMAFLTDFLAEEGFIEFHKGIYFDECRRKSRMRATPKLLRHFRKHRVPGKGIILSRKPGIIMRDAKKRDVSFDTDTLEVKNLLRNIWKINKHLKEYEISLDVEKIPAKLLAEYKPDIIGKYQKYIRIFNNRDFNQGGRFYCHWTQMIPKELRKHILINGKETVELDYSCLHITMLYALDGKIPPEGDLYNLIHISSEHREIIKKAFLIAINDEAERSVIAAINKSRKEIERETGIISPKAKEIFFYMQVTHPALIGHFCRGRGLFLQRIDSDLAENIMLELFSQGICVLSIHDSFIVNTEHRDKLYESMKYHFYNRFNFYPNIK